MKKTNASAILSPAILDEVICRYNGPHRFYHNADHINDILSKANSDKNKDFLFELYLAIIYHDIVYDPTRDDNEEKSVELFRAHHGDGYPEVELAILETKTHKPTTALSKALCNLDLGILKQDMPAIVDFELKIFKEYQFVDFKKYKDNRIKILAELGARQEHIDYVKNFTPKIAVYAGSFNPFHVGHLDILKQAEAIFDKVIISRGINDNKAGNKVYAMPEEELKYRQIDSYSGLLTDYIKGLGYDVTLVRGLRSADDFNAEKTQLQYLRDFMPDIKVVSLFCKPELQHISSSACRMLSEKFKDVSYIVK